MLPSLQRGLGLRRGGNMLCHPETIATVFEALSKGKGNSITVSDFMYLTQVLRTVRLVNRKKRQDAIINGRGGDEDEGAGREQRGAAEHHAQRLPFRRALEHGIGHHFFFQRSAQDGRHAPGRRRRRANP